MSVKTLNFTIKRSLPPESATLNLKMPFALRENSCDPIILSQRQRGNLRVNSYSGINRAPQLMAVNQSVNCIYAIPVSIL